jgi:hypothetical protein
MRRPIPEDPVETKQLTLLKDRGHRQREFGDSKMSLEHWAKAAVAM